MNASRYWLSAALLAGLALTACQAPNTSFVASRITSAARDYLFALQGSFQIASVDAADQDLINEVKAAFISDLEAGREEDYRRSPHFSIHLLAGSEGSYFTSPDFLQNSVESLLATLVIPQTSGNPLIFKGEFRADRFYFADPAQQLELTTASKAYLLTADSDMTDYVVQTYKGEVQPAESSSSPEAISETPAPAEASPESVSAAPAAEAHHPEGVEPPPLLMPGLPLEGGMVYREAYPVPAHPALSAPAAYLNGQALYPSPARGPLRMPPSAGAPRSPNWQQDPFAEASRFDMAYPLARPAEGMPNGPTARLTESPGFYRAPRAPKPLQPARAWSKATATAVILQP
ncbi:MAG: hypothetical protein ACO1RX_07085 [Candidatus Sericytochromatia bacterium]